MKSFLRTALFALAALPLSTMVGKAEDLSRLVSDRPGSTLLLPYFEVGFSTGPDTLFTINNSNAGAMMTHVTIWSDLSVPVLGFNVYLTGYDTQLIDLRKVINGVLPRTASAGQDPTDTISNKGVFSQDINFASCNQPLSPTPPESFRLPPANLTSAEIAHVKASLTGKASALAGGKCSGLRYADNIARGYVTIDTINACTDLNPGDSGYFPSLVVSRTLDISYDYYLMAGEAFLRNIGGHSLVSIRSDTVDPEVSNPGEYTFYGRYTDAPWDASDHRQPLGTAFAARYNGGTTTSSRTQFVVWRDSKAKQAPFTCGSPPSWYPLDTEELVAFDNAEDAIALSDGAIFGAETQKFAPALPFTSGWLYIDLDTSGAGGPSSDVDAAQGWVYSILNPATVRRIVPAAFLESAVDTTHTLKFP